MTPSRSNAARRLPWSALQLVSAHRLLRDGAGVGSGRQRLEERRVAIARRRLLVRQGESVVGVAADRLEHRELLAVPSHQALVDQRTEGLQLGITDHLGCLEAEAAGEDGQPGEQPAFVVVEQLV